MRKKLFLFLTLTVFYFPGLTQELPYNNLGVTNSGKNPEELFSELNMAKPDTNKVKVLVYLCGYHWSNGRNTDSISLYAEEARTLSRALHYNPGFYEACFILCKNHLIKGEVSKAVKGLAEVSDDQEARLRLAIGEHYLFLPGLEKKNLDSAFLYFSEALRIAKLISNEKWKHQCLIALGKYYFADGQFNSGKNSFLEIIKDLQRTGNRSAEAYIWSELGIYMPDTDSTFKDQLMAYGNAAKMYLELKDTANATSALYEIGGVYMRQSDFAQAKLQYEYALRLRKASGMKKLYKIQALLAFTSYGAGNLDEALALVLEAKKNIVSFNDQGMSRFIALLQGLIYRDDGQQEKSLQYLLEIKNDYDGLRYLVYSKIAEQYLLLNQPHKALLFIRDAENKNLPIWPADKETLAAIKGDIYSALEKPVTAEKYYLQMIQLDKEVQTTRSREIQPLSLSLSGSEAYYKIAKFYEDQKKYNIAGSYADRALQINSFTGIHQYTAQLMRQIWWIKFKADSVAGNYISAIQNYEKYTALSDSIFNEKKTRQLQGLQVQHETEKKENDIKSRDQQIQTLTQNDLLRQSNLEQAHLIRNISIALLAILLASGGLLYKQYRQKQKSAALIAETNKVISQKNLAITQKNETLEQLVTEKEWLLKEVHHRVKNNLHTVICLLESQAAYLENDARKANEISQQRIYTMSLIHQKIYQSEDIKSIDMSVYLPEFIQYLDDSFGNNLRVHFNVDIDTIHLDISQAVPVALIINVAVTNSIKYAFPGNRKGTIDINMQSVEDQIT